MGGSRSTRWGNYQKRTQVEECLALDLSFLHQQGILSSPSAASGWLDWTAGPDGTLLGTARYYLGPVHADRRELVLRRGEQPDPHDPPQVVTLEYVKVGCAPRWLALCPECGERRVQRLFLPPKGTRFGCRHCHGLQYRSVQEHDGRIDRIVKAIRTGDEAAFDRYEAEFDRGGYRSLVWSQLFLTAMFKVFPGK